MIGLDIGTYSIKAVSITLADGKAVLRGCNRVNRIPEEALHESVKKVISGDLFAVEPLAIAVSGPRVIVRFVEWPVMTEAELVSAARFEVENEASFDMQDAIIDCRIVSREAATNKIGVLIIAAAAAAVKTMVDEVTAAGRAVASIDVDSLALCNAFLRTSAGQKVTDKDTATALVNIGDTFVNMSIISRGIPFLARDTAGIGAELSGEIARRLGVAGSEAYKLKHSLPASPERVSELAGAMINKLAKEMKLSMGYFESQYSLPVEAIYVSGGSARLAGLTGSLAAALDVPVSVWDPFGALAVGDAGPFADAPGEFAVAVGLALGSANNA
ncbi:MAG: pilus assembly protein PilM [Candidatus Omnitrophota bacterium]